MLTARNEHDRKSFVNDLKEAILEVCCLYIIIVSVLFVNTLLLLKNTPLGYQHVDRL